MKSILNLSFNSHDELFYEFVEQELTSCLRNSQIGDGFKLEIAPKQSRLGFGVPDLYELFINFSTGFATGVISGILANILYDRIGRRATKIFVNGTPVEFDIDKLSAAIAQALNAENQKKSTEEDTKNGKK